mmetsp:Transcript_23573/g.44512  ORF Transcript_23573/g.44512 Transcript_23573/m.44512 type:complete len:169 (+) Transcript_23573:96-602(+)
MGCAASTNVAAAEIIEERMTRPLRLPAPGEFSDLKPRVEPAITYSDNGLNVPADLGPPDDSAGEPEAGVDADISSRCVTVHVPHEVCRVIKHRDAPDACGHAQDSCDRHMHDAHLQNLDKMLQRISRSQGFLTDAVSLKRVESGMDPLPPQRRRKSGSKFIPGAWTLP